ncbi:alpha/beta fold hydrolase [Spongisporangium articulatum]|uniref:Alpha/beta fold hydrolase n=1 Tax=Spongisporangium articulatum TaxID=3362603 RepID=A0ABW8AP29_9ACTN
MTWLQAYGRSGAKEELAKGADADTYAFTGTYTPGDKPLALVLLPALFIGEWMWEKQFEALKAAGWPIVQFTESISLVDRKTARSINRMAARIMEVCRSFTDRDLVVAGDSLGGLVAFEFARSFPDRTAGIVASGAPGLNTTVSQIAREVGEGAHTPQQYADNFMAKLMYDPSAHDIDEERYQATVKELSKPATVVSMLGALKAISRYNSRKIVMELPTPKLFIWGRQDEITPAEEWEEATPLMQDARIHVIDECGHGPMFEKPEEYNRELLGFLDELTARRAPGPG